MFPEPIERTCDRTEGQAAWTWLELIRTVFPPQKGIRLVGVTLSDFRLANTAAEDELHLSSSATLSVKRIRAMVRVAYHPTSWIALVLAALLPAASASTSTPRFIAGDRRSAQAKSD